MDHDDRRRRAHATFDRALDLLLTHDMAGFAALWAPAGTMEFPFAAPGAPARLDGRDEVAAYLAGYTDLVRPRAVVEQTRHDTADPDTIVVEFAVAGTATASGAEYVLRYVAVVTVGAEGITAYRDHWSPAAAQEIVGGSAA